jgi:hypothetical protein
MDYVAYIPRRLDAWNPREALQEAIMADVTKCPVFGRNPREQEP